MPIKKVQPKRIKYFPVKLAKRQKEVDGFNFREAITILGGITGLIVALLWIAGRFYANGYFAEMNIPLYQINYSIWDYAELAWLRLVTYFFIAVSAPLFLLITCSIIFLILLFVLQKMLPKLIILATFQRLVAQITGFFNSYRILAVTGLIVIFFYCFLLLLTDIHAGGQADGLRAVLTGSYSVDVYSKEYLPMGPYDVVSGTSMFHYGGLHLLIANGGKYYLFRDINPASCQPEQVYVINDIESIHLVFSELSLITTPCTGLIP